jgi:hypothetical protein
MYDEERPHLKALPTERFRCFTQQTRTVDHAGLVQVAGSYYAAGSALPYSEVTVRIFDNEIQILNEQGELLRRHEKSARKGEYKLSEEDRIFNPSRETARLIGKVAKIGPHSAQLAREIFARLGRPGEKAIYGMANLTRRYPRADIEHACEQVLRLSRPSYQALKRILERTVNRAATLAAAASLQQSGPHIRSIEEYQAFWDFHTQPSATDPSTAHTDR